MHSGARGPFDWEGDDDADWDGAEWGPYDYDDDEHALGPAKGCMRGILIGAAMWSLVLIGWLAGGWKHAVAGMAGAGAAFAAWMAYAARRFRVTRARAAGRDEDGGPDDWAVTSDEQTRAP